MFKELFINCSEIPVQRFESVIETVIDVAHEVAHEVSSDVTEVANEVPNRSIQPFIVLCFCIGRVLLLSSLVMGLFALDQLTLSFLNHNSAQAEIYHWQDAEGNWHFTDDKEKNQGTAVNKNYSQSSAPKEDLAQRLIDKLQPTTAIDEAIMATVSIHSALGQGGGFFINDEGYIVTLKEVVRPAHAKQSSQSDLAGLHEKMKVARRAYLDEKEVLKGYRTKVDELKLRRVQVSGSKRDQVTEELKQAKGAHDEFRRQVRALDRTYREARMTYERRQTDLNIRMNRAKLDNSFSVYLADGSKYVADLVKVDEKSQLALLQLSGFFTPRLYLNEYKRPSHGAKVFEINSVQAAQRASGTAQSKHRALIPNTVVKVATQQLWFDKAVVVGNAGAPMVNEQGQLVALVAGFSTDLTAVEAERRGVSAELVYQVFNDYAW